jgi:hypothetical protein
MAKDYGVVIAARVPTPHAEALHHNARQAGRSTSAELRLALAPYFTGNSEAGSSPGPAPRKSVMGSRADARQS